MTGRLAIGLLCFGQDNPLFEPVVVTGSVENRGRVPPKDDLEVEQAELDGAAN